MVWRVIHRGNESEVEGGEKCKNKTRRCLYAPLTTNARIWDIINSMRYTWGQNKPKQRPLQGSDTFVFPLNPRENNTPSKYFWGMITKWHNHQSLASKQNRKRFSPRVNNNFTLQTEPGDRRNTCLSHLSTICLLIAAIHAENKKSNQCWPRRHPFIQWHVASIASRVSFLQKKEII